VYTKYQGAFSPHVEDEEKGELIAILALLEQHLECHRSAPWYKLFLRPQNGEWKKAGTAHNFFHKWNSRGHPGFGLLSFLRNLYAHRGQSIRERRFDSTSAFDAYINNRVPRLASELRSFQQQHLSHLDPSQNVSAAEDIADLHSRATVIASGGGGSTDDSNTCHVVGGGGGGSKDDSDIFPVVGGGGGGAKHDVSPITASQRQNSRGGVNEVSSGLESRERPAMSTRQKDMFDVPIIRDARGDVAFELIELEEGIYVACVGSVVYKHGVRRLYRLLQVDGTYVETLSDYELLVRRKSEFVVTFGRTYHVPSLEKKFKVGPLVRYWLSKM